VLVQVASSIKGLWLIVGLEGGIAGTWGVEGGQTLMLMLAKC